MTTGTLENQRMATTKQSGVMPRAMLGKDATEVVAGALQRSLTDMIDLALLLKQAHWNVVGSSFKSIHEQLDEIIDDVREGSDEIAERLAQIGVAPDGRSQTVSKESRLARYPEGFVQSGDTVTGVSDAMATAIEGLRRARAETAEPDPVTEDLLIGVIGPLEKHLWMMQARESKV